ncbi:transcriptional regulator [Vibrio sp. UCD-FRSSP16_10]|uniref:TetR family transcriptional regulator n=1 Tax=unclassified Vibrio TaxID=2614977 RepID=UPI0007FC5BFA|nr:MULTISPECIES: TetR family transcriptional regulator [unclassified Vibrio]OBT07928.1 transcriptional regulator [Vibrio sp. UCD-FRSSP16_30]OBT17103.1 transcriptional regulator [Vibrio sp. UCD-FRSSP16_10]
MPKRSKEDTEITIKKIMDVVVEQLLTIGYDKMSYTTLSQATGVSRTGISHHFPKKTDFTNALDGAIVDLLSNYLEFESGLKAFTKSWVSSLEAPKFLAILRLMFHHVTIFDGAQEFTRKGIDSLFLAVKARFGDDSKSELERLLGLSVVKLAN